jgi:hypothetical protein
MRGVKKVNGWVTATVTWFPIPDALCETWGARLQSIEIGGGPGSKQAGELTTIGEAPR